jgi:hypothetical protein
LFPSYIVADTKPCREVTRRPWKWVSFLHALSELPFYPTSGHLTFSFHLLFSFFTSNTLCFALTSVLMVKNATIFKMVKNAKENHHCLTFITSFKPLATFNWCRMNIYHKVKRMKTKISQTFTTFVKRFEYWNEVKRLELKKLNNNWWYPGKFNGIEWIKLHFNTHLYQSTPPNYILYYPSFVVHISTTNIVVEF